VADELKHASSVTLVTQPAAGMDGIREDNTGESREWCDDIDAYSNYSLWISGFLEWKIQAIAESSKS